MTLDRELMKCSVGDAPAKTWAPLWFKAEVENLRNIQDKFDIVAVVPPIENPLNCNPVQVDALKTKLGNALPRVRALWPNGAPKKCGEDPLAYEKAYHAVTIALLKGFLDDPVFGQRAIWSACGESFPPRELTEKTDLDDLLDKKLKVCGDLLNPPNLSRAPVRVNLKVAMTATVQEHNLPDLEHVYAIQYTAMADTIKHTEYTVEKYPNGTLKSVNAVIEDKTAEVIQSTLRGALNLVAASGGFSPTFPNAQADEPGELPIAFEAWREREFPPLCPASIRQILQQKADAQGAAEKAAAEILALSKAADDATAAAKKKTDDAAKAQIELDALPANDPGRPKLTKDISDLKAEAKALTDKADKATKDKSALEKEKAEVLDRFATLRKQLTRTSTQLFEAGKGATAQEFSGAQETSLAWLEPAALPKYCQVNNSPPDLIPCEGQAPNQIPSTLVAWIGSYVPPLAGDFTQTVSGTDLVYREPAHGLLLACREHSCFDSTNHLAVTPENTVLVVTSDFPQLGVLATLPLVNKPFQNNSLVVNFSPSGSLEKLVYKSNARAEKAAKAFEGASEDILAFADAKRGAKKKNLDNNKAEVDAETALIKSKLEREKAKKELDALLNPPAPN